MGNLLGGSGGGSGGLGGYGSQCCDPVVDPITLVATIGAIAALSLFLRQAVIDFMIMSGRKKRDINFLLEGINQFNSRLDTFLKIMTLLKVIFNAIQKRICYS